MCFEVNSRASSVVLMFPQDAPVLPRARRTVHSIHMHPYLQSRVTNSDSRALAGVNERVWLGLDLVDIGPRPGINMSELDVLCSTNSR